MLRFFRTTLNLERVGEAVGRDLPLAGHVADDVRVAVGIDLQELAVERGDGLEAGEGLRSAHSVRVLRSPGSQLINLLGLAASPLRECGSRSEEVATRAVLRPRIRRNVRHVTRLLAVSSASPRARLVYSLHDRGR